MRKWQVQKKAALVESSLSNRDHPQHKNLHIICWVHKWFIAASSARSFLSLLHCFARMRELTSGNINESYRMHIKLYSIWTRAAFRYFRVGGGLHKSSLDCETLLISLKIRYLIRQTLFDDYTRQQLTQTILLVRCGSQHCHQTAHCLQLQFKIAAHFIQLVDFTQYGWVEKLYANWNAFSSLIFLNCI